MKVQSIPVLLFYCHIFPISIETRSFIFGGLDVNRENDMSAEISCFRVARRLVEMGRFKFKL